jgi:hypothetical protein
VAAGADVELARLLLDAREALFEAARPLVIAVVPVIFVSRIS